MLKIFEKFTKNHRTEIISIFCVLAIFLAATLPTLGAASIWFDEAYSAFLVRYDFSKIWEFTSWDVHPPLYYFALRIWSLIFGASDFALRALSVAFGGATIFAMFLFLRRAFDQKIATISTALLAISPMFVRYSQEARMYAMVAFLATLAAWAYFELYVSKISKRKNLWRILFVLACACGIWTQYLFAIVPISLWIFRAISLRKSLFRGQIFTFLKEFFGEKWLILNAIFATSFLLWLSIFLAQAKAVKKEFWIKELNFNTIPNLFSNFLLYMDSISMTGRWSAFALAILAILIFAISKLPASKKIPRANFFAAMAIFPVAILFAVSMQPARSVFVDRYLLPALAFFAIYCGIIICLSWENRKTKSLSVFLAGMMIFAFVKGNFEINRLRGFSKTSELTTETRQIMEKIWEKARPGEPILTTSGYFIYEIAQYSTPENKVWFTGWNQDFETGSVRPLRDNTDFKIDDIAEFSKNYSAIWVVSGHGETEKAPLDPSWKLVFEEKFYDKITGQNRYLVQKFTVEKSLLQNRNVVK